MAMFGHCTLLTYIIIFNQRTTGQFHTQAVLETVAKLTVQAVSATTVTFSFSLSSILLASGAHCNSESFSSFNFLVAGRFSVEVPAVLVDSSLSAIGR